MHGHAAVTDKNEKKYRMTEYRLETRKERAVGWKSTSDNASNIPLPRPKTQNKIPAGLIRAHRAGGRIPMNFKVCSNLDTMERAGAPYACPRPQKLRRGQLAAGIGGGGKPPATFLCRAGGVH